MILDISMNIGDLLYKGNHFKFHYIYIQFQ